MIPHPPVGVLAALARSVDNDTDRQDMAATLDLRDEDLQREIAREAYTENEGFESARGITEDDYVRWTGVIMNGLADRLEQAP